MLIGTACYYRRQGETPMLDPTRDDVPTEIEEDPVEGQTALFDDADVHATWHEWEGMPEFAQRDLQPWGSITVNFRSADDLHAFEAVVGQTIPWPTARGMWYPKLEITRFIDKRYRDEAVPADNYVPGSTRNMEIKDLL